MRTKRRIFYLDVEGHEVVGAIAEGLVPAVMSTLNRVVVATLEVSQSISATDRMGREHFLLTDIAVQEELDN